MKRMISVLTILFLLVALPGCSVLQKLGLQKSSDEELRPVSSIVIGEDEASKLTDKTPIRLYFANADNSKLKLEIRYIETTEAKRSVSNLASIVIRELIKGPSDETALKRTIPAEAKLRTPVSISDKVAVVDMSKEFKTKHPGGKDAEKMTIYSIVNSLTEIDGIQKVKFTIAGKAQKEYMGNFKFDSMFPRSAALISRETASEPALDGNEGSNSVNRPATGDTTETSGQSKGTSDNLDILE